MEQLKLNMIPSGVNPVFHASQYDKGRQIRFVLDETLSGAEVTVSYRAKDGTEHGNVQTSVSGNTITDTIPEEVLTDYGMIEGEVNIDGIGSLNFFVEVEKDAYDGGVITTQTATGAIATFETNIETAFVSLKSDINPVQDLHGYSKPWSGGAGKNKLNYEAWKTTGITRGTAVFENNGVTITATSNDAFTNWNVGEYPVNARLPISEGETITLSWEETTNKSGQIFIFPNGTTTGLVTVNNGAVKKATYTATSGVTFITFRFGVAYSGDTIAYKNIQIEKGSQATSWEPYENICSISGFNALNVTRTGKNRLNYDAWKTTSITRGTAVWENNGVTLTATSNDCFTTANERIPVTEGETITLSWEETTNKEGAIYIFPNGSTSGMVRTSNRVQKYISYTATSGVTFVTFRFGVANSGDTIAYKNIQIEKGSTATDFKTYNGQTATVNFGQTVYGGVADVTNEKVTITHGIVDLGTLSWVKISMGGGRYGFRATIPTMALTPAANVKINAICEGYEIKNGNEVYLGNIGLAGWGVGTHDIAVYDDTLESGSAVDFQTAMNGIELVFELATPTEITTTPENLTAIVGQNNVYADTNGDTEVEYYIEV